MAAAAMRPLVTRLFTLTHIAMASSFPSSSSSSPSRRLARLARHLTFSSSSDELTSVGAPAAAADAVPPRSRTAATKVHAAVLVCLFEDPRDGPHVILTKRASSLSTHSGEVALPGGKVDEGDADAKATALREAKEEIGLDPALVSVVAVLEPFLSKNGLNVVPVIGMIPDRALFKPVLNKDEVEDIFDAPLEMFLKDDNRRTQEMNWMGMDICVQFFDYQADGKEFVIWGLTAHILTHAAAVIFQRQPSFTERPRPSYISSPPDTNNPEPDKT